MKAIKILEIKSEIGAGTHGASMGIDAIKTAALNKDNFFFSHYPDEEIENENQLLYQPVQFPHARYIEGLVKVYEKMSATVANACRQGFFPVILSGDHATAGATIAGLKIANPDTKLGVVWMDAHADLHTPYTSPSGNMHGMPLSVSLNEDNRSYQKNELSPAAIRFWNQLKQTGNIAPKISPKDLVIIGLRDHEKEEQAFIEAHGIQTFSAANVRKKGSRRIAEESLTLLSKCDLIYVSFDVDSLDPALSKGTGTPVPNGLLLEEATQLIHSLLADHKVCCFEITEVNPTLDTKNKMAEIAFDILDSSAKIIESR